MKSPTHAAALEYALKGWYVFPCVVGGKAPATKSGHHDATTDPAQIDAWWAENPNYNVAIAVAPSGLVDLDVDVGRKKDGTWKQGRKSLAEIEHELTPTLLADTGGVGEDGRPGVHAIYARPAGVEAKRVIGFRDGLDLIGEGYIVAAPSFNTETGRYYRWSQLLPIAPLPPFLQAVTRAPRATEKVQLIGTPIPEGGRNNAMFKLACALRDTGIGAEALARALDAENKQRFTPPLEDAEMALIVNSALTTVQPRRDVALGAMFDDEVRAALAPAQVSRSEWLENVATTPQPPMLLYSTTFPELDRLIGGFSTRQLTGVIGPPSAGKSALIGHWLMALAMQRPVLHVSLELLRHELFIRYAAHRMEFPWKDGLYGKVPQESMAGAVRGIRIRLMGAEDFDSNAPWDGIEQEMQRMQAANGGIAPVLAIDYIQLMARGASTEMRHKVGDLTKHARQLSQRFDTVVLGVFTTQRFSYSGKTGDALKATDDPTAFLGAAKESGDIEFDCATLMFLDVDKLHEGANKPARIAVARCRVGDVGFVGLRARLDIGKFEADDSALVEMSSKAREERRQENTLGAVSAALLELIPQMPNRPWRDFHAALSKKFNHKLAKEAKDKLVEDGRIAVVDRVGVDEFRRKLTGTTLVLRDADSPPSVPTEEVEP